MPAEVLVAVRVNVAACGPENGKYEIPENRNSTDPEAVTVVVGPETDVEIAHCCVAPLAWKYWANVTGPAYAAGAARPAIRIPAAKPVRERFTRKFGGMMGSFASAIRRKEELGKCRAK